MKACTGCGKSEGPMDRLITLYDSTGDVEVASVCRGRAYDAPKSSCVQKVLEKQGAVCIVCGSEQMYFGGRKVRPICKQCDATIAQARAQTDVSWYAFRPFDLFSRDLETQHVPYDELGQALRHLLCGDGREQFVSEGEWLTFGRELTGYDNLTTGDIWARLTKTQAKGLEEFKAAFTEFVSKAIAEAEARGGALLVKLARGEVSVDDYDDARKPANKRRAKR